MFCLEKNYFIETNQRKKIVYTGNIMCSLKVINDNDCWRVLSETNVSFVLRFKLRVISRLYFLEKKFLKILFLIEVKEDIMDAGLVLFCIFNTVCHYNKFKL